MKVTITLDLDREEEKVLFDKVFKEENPLPIYIPKELLQDIPEKPKYTQAEYIKKTEERVKPKKVGRSFIINKWNKAQDELLRDGFNKKPKEELLKDINAVGPTRTIAAMNMRATIRGYTRGHQNFTKDNPNLGVYKAPELETESKEKVMCSICNKHEILRVGDMCEVCEEEITSMQQTQV